MQADVPCRVCGDVVRQASAALLEHLNVPELPVWLTGLCPYCLSCIDVATDDEGYPIAAVTVENLNEFLTERVREYASRIGDGRTVDRCEAISWSALGYEEADAARCARFAGHDWNGRRVCGHCRRSLIVGSRPPEFIGTGYRRAKPYLIWARDADELMERARELASLISHVWLTGA